MWKRFADVFHRHPILTALLRKGVVLETNQTTYDAPVVLETFEALEVMGAAEGFEVYTVGNGSQVAIINVPR